MMLGILDGGTYYHTEAIHGERYRGFFDRVLYLPELCEEDLAGISVLIVTDRLNPTLLRHVRPLLIGHAARGGTLVVFAENRSETWLPGVEWTFRPTNFWWWLEKGLEPVQQVIRPDHEMFRFVEPRNTVWHFHGVLHPPAGAEPLIVLRRDGLSAGHDGCLFYDDRVTMPGRLLVTTLDPFYHHGSHFMPATTCFLDGFLPWMRALADAAQPNSAKMPPDAMTIGQTSTSPQPRRIARPPRTS